MRDDLKSAPYRETVKGLIIRVRLTPNSSRDAIEGLVQQADGVWALKTRVRSVPEKGKANKAVIKLIAKSMSLAPSRLSLISGQKDRNKELLVENVGDDIEQAKEWLATLQGKK